MAKISDRNRLSRGILLNPDHAFDVQDDASTQLQGNIEVENLDAAWAPWRVNLHTVSLDGMLFLDTGDRGERGHLMIPFALPPPQQFFSTTAVKDVADPILVLDEIQISFDQRAEPCAIQGVAGTEGDMDFANLTDTLNVRVSLREKPMTIFGATEFVPRNEVVGLDIPEGFFTASDFRNNPAIITGLERVLDPYRTYVVYVEASELAKSGGPDLALPSLQISLRGRSKIFERSTVADEVVQNMPSKHNGAASAPTVTITRPAAGASPVSADAAAGINTNLEIIDQVFVDKLRGGYGEFADVRPTEHMQDDAAYEVIAVNLFGMGTHVGDSNPTRLPYIGSDPHTGDTCDRRIIPIKYPLIIHHVLAVQSWATTPSAGNLKPNNANLVHEVGVGLGVGFRADDYALQQVAYATWTGTEASRASHRIDRILERRGGTMGDETSDLDMFNIPLVNDGAALGVTYPNAGINTGDPIFVGRGVTGTQARTTIAQGFPGAKAAPVTAGTEQWIEVRWRFGDAVNGLGHAASYPSGTVFVGHGGFWVYLICEKPIVRPGEAGMI